jgi:hypothetical protein
MELGAAEARQSNAKFVNLRIGKIAQTSNEPQVGYSPAKTVNKSGTENHFFAKPYDSIVGYIDDIRWHTYTLKDGTELTGWNVAINTGKDLFILGVSSNDRPFDGFMNSLCNVDFTQPVKFQGFIGESKDAQGKKTGKKQKVLLLYQTEGNPKDFVKGKHEMKWLSQLLVKKLKEKVELTEDEKRNIAYLDNGKIDGDYPYVKETLGGKWNFDNWREFLMGEMYSYVIPAVGIAKEDRGDISFTGEPDETVETIVVAEDDDSDSIPF